MISNSFYHDKFMLNLRKVYIRRQPSYVYSVFHVIKVIILKIMMFSKKENMNLRNPATHIFVLAVL
jgi:hypothetical protein